MPGEEVPQGPSRSQQIEDLIGQSELSDIAGEISRVREAPQTGGLDKSAGMPEDGGASLTEAATSGNTAKPVQEGEYAYTDGQLKEMGIPTNSAEGAQPIIDSVPGMPKIEKNQTNPQRAVVNIPESEWTPEMRRKAALASGNIVRDTFGAIEPTKPVHPGQLGKGSEG